MSITIKKTTSIFYGLITFCMVMETVQTADLKHNIHGDL